MEWYSWNVLQLVFSAVIVREKEKEKNERECVYNNFLCKCYRHVFFFVAFHIGVIIHRCYITYGLFLFFSLIYYIYCLIYFFTRVKVRTVKLRSITLSNFITIILPGVMLAQLYRRYFTPRHLRGERLVGFDWWNWHDTVTGVCSIWLSITHRNEQ